jgi:hypothetical protein
VQLAEPHASELIAASESRYPLLLNLDSVSAWLDLERFPLPLCSVRRASHAKLLAVSIASWSAFRSSKLA